MRRAARPRKCAQSFVWHGVGPCAKSQTLMKLNRVDVNLGPRSYPIVIGNDIVSDLGELVREQGLKQTSAFVLTNSQVGAKHFAKVRDALERASFARVVRHNIPCQEMGKSWKQLEKTCAKLLAEFPDTGSIPLIFLLGGGVVGDLGGFAAGIFRRGVPFVQLPTSLLAAVDSSVGGKVAVNFNGVKNILGIFNQPRLVVCDLALLRTMDARSFRSGISEVIKYGAVCKAALFEQLESGGVEKLIERDSDTLADIVSQCVEIKARVVEQDEFDPKGIRNVLNFGHTIGHALELSAYNPESDWREAPSHGEAIAMGMAAAANLSRKLGMVDESFKDRLRSLISRAGLPASLREFRAEIPGKDYPDLCDRVIRAMQMDKKFRDGKNVFVLPTGVGSWQQVENVDWALVREAVRSALA
jgi:3-dehydroquinate synthase